MVIVHQKYLLILRVSLGCQMIRETGSIELKCPSGGPRSVRTNANVQKIRSRLKRKKRISSRILANELTISRTSVQRIL